MTPFCLWVVRPSNYRHSLAFEELAVGLQSAFKQIGYNTPIYYNQSEITATAITATPVILGAHLLCNIQRPSIPANSILFNLEQILLNSPWLTQDYLTLLSRFQVWDYSRSNITALQNLGLKNITLCEIDRTG